MPHAPVGARKGLKKLKENKIQVLKLGAKTMRITSNKRTELILLNIRITKTN
jgi:hypothetical protein